MHLDKIKLVGFKSFVDPTTIEFKSHLTAVVGPNGCGKSNVVDALRWVIGESSAKQLRGELLTDVIFNGTSSRKPVGQASIELVFDNACGTITGEYASFNEISIRRVINRDGQSTFYLNSSRCRRRDIMDLLAGTGLGPRSYAIIEQGMISQLIESKPEDLRVYLDEAAGISKYKERRRETENRIRHTKENLERLSDVREEIGKQLAHLKRQANAARRYKDYQEEKRTISAQLQALKWQELAGDIESQEAIIVEQETQNEAVIAEIRSIDTEHARDREQAIEAREAFEEIQGRYYQIGAEISRCEQEIQHTKEREQALEQDLNRVNENFAREQAQLQSDQQELQEIKQSIAQQEQNGVQANEAAIKAQEAYQSAENSMRDLQARWDDFLMDHSATTRQVEVENTKIAQLQQRCESANQRLSHMQDEQNTLIDQSENQELSSLGAESEALSTQISEVQSLIQQDQEVQSLQREKIEATQKHIWAHQETLQKIREKKSSLEALQQAALGKDDSVVNEWLAKNALENHPRLAEKLEVTDGWEVAVETVLENVLDGVCVENFTEFAKVVSELEKGQLTLIQEKTSAQSPVHHNKPTLQDKIQGVSALEGFLSRIYIAEDVDSALTLQRDLTELESVVTRDGIWMSRQFLKMNRRRDEKSGILQREQSLKSLEQEFNQEQKTIAGFQAELQNHQRHLAEIKSQLEQKQSDVREISNILHEVRNKLSAKQAEFDHNQKRLERLLQEMNDASQLVAGLDSQLAQSQELYQLALNKKAQEEERRHQLQQEKETHQDILSEAQQTAQESQRHADSLRHELENANNKINYLQQNVHRHEQQLEELTTRKDDLKALIEKATQNVPEIQQSLEQHLEVRVNEEAALQESRQKVQTLEHQLRELEKSRQEKEQQSQKINEHLQQLRMQWQGDKVRQNTFIEQLQEDGFEIEQVLNEMPEEAEVTSWEEQNTRMENRIQRLGAINLAAIEECAQLEERSEYLESQNNDLEEALEILSTAIGKIDHETKTRFKETFDKVNEAFIILFPKVFGGGKGRLELTSDDLLETGIAVMAQPPGKRNSSIQLLSGGEKAMTAIALLFSVFQLNPAPFCVLDEVDAPLDDANISRFVQLVKEMSESVQFIFISHNKLTIEMADQLCGVTMHEAGVSRMVSVDIAEAIRMAEQ